MSMDAFTGRIRNVSICGGLAVTALLLLVTLFIPIVYDTLHVTDTTFLAQVARWILDGAMPGVDFGHFYGGMHEWFVAQGLRLSGGTIKALDYALVFEFLVIAIGLLLITWRRFDPVLIVLLVLLIAALLFARTPLEEYPFLRSIDSAHSFAYNRLGSALAVLCAAALLVQSRSHGGEALTGAVAGIASVTAMLAKSTFFPVALALLFGLALSRRWIALAGSVIAMAAFFLWLDPTGARTFGTLSYSMASSGTGVSESWLIRKAIQLIYTQQVQVIALLVLLVMVLRARSLLPVCCAVMLLTAFWATTVTMGPAGLAGHQSAPLLATVAVLLLPYTRSAALPIAAVLYLSFVLPHTFNTLGAAAKAMLRAGHVVEESGPLAGYYADGETSFNMRRNPETAIVKAAQYRASGQEDTGVDYIRLMDALRLVQEIPDLPGLGLVSDTRLGISFAAGTLRVEGFPAWLRNNSPEMAADRTPLRDASLILLSDPTPSRYTETVRSHMGDDFTFCARSPLWVLYVRNSDKNRLCSNP